MYDVMLYEESCYIYPQISNNKGNCYIQILICAFGVGSTEIVNNFIWLYIWCYI